MCSILPVSLQCNVLYSPVSLQCNVLYSPVSLQCNVLYSPVSLQCNVLYSPVSLQCTVLYSPVSLQCNVLYSPVSLQCNAECAVLERNRRLAAALQIKNPELSGKAGPPPYPTSMLEMARKAKGLAEEVHQQLTDLVQLAQQVSSKTGCHVVTVAVGCGVVRWVAVNYFDKLIYLL